MAGNPITFDSLLFFVAVGMTLGSMYAVAATGLVVTDTTSGAVNFARGAIGMLMAFVYWELKVDLGRRAAQVRRDDGPPDAHGLPYLVLVVVGGVCVVSGARLGSLFLQTFTGLVEILPGVAALTW
jgi:branched-subunit amino acid ABC-type transport system permease component